MRVAVTGASGFIGRHVLAELACRQVETVAIIRGAGAGDMPGGPRVVNCEIGNGPVSMDRIGNPDVLIHLAWGGLPNYQSLHHFEEELPAQYVFLSNLIRSGLSALVVTGTCFEYGMQSGPLREDTTTLPNNCYGLAKDMLRRQLEMLREQHPFAFVWARLFYPFGEGQGPKSLFSQLRTAVTRGEESFNMSAGEQLRDYLPVDTVARQLVDLALGRADCGPVNICSGEPVSIRRLVESWLTEYGWSIRLNLGHYPYPAYEPMAFWGDATKLKSVLASLHVPNQGS